MPDSLEEARYRVVRSLDREDLSALSYVAEHDEGQTVVVNAGTGAGGQTALAGSLIATIAHKTGVDVEKVAHRAVKVANGVEIGSEEDI